MKKGRCPLPPLPSSGTRFVHRAFENMSIVAQKIAQSVYEKSRNEGMEEGAAIAKAKVVAARTAAKRKG